MNQLIAGFKTFWSGFGTGLASGIVLCMAWNKGLKSKLQDLIEKIKAKIRS